MTAYKITISLPSRAAEHVKRAVKSGRAASASAYIAQAIEQKAASGSLRAMFAEMLDETGGPMTKAEIRATERIMGITPAQRREKARRDRRPAPKRTR
jgi:Arc/MetJ-type ribon-helix-helix transcriptional regulator